MPDNIVIKVDGISKNFKLPHQKADSIKSLFTGFYKKNTKKYTETQHALKDINFEIKEGEFFGIVGRNGSGKSTLLKILAGIYQPTKGKVGVKGKLVPFIELGVGFDPELTGRENVYLNGALLGFDKKKVDSMYDDIVSFAELEKFMDQKLKNYSSGMQVRLAFSMATRSDADILLIDEVLAVGDADFQRKCFNYFKKLKRDRKTVVFVSHDMDAIREYCDNAILINGGRVVFTGGAQDVARDYSRLFNNTERGVGRNIKSGDRWGNKKVIISKAILLLDNVNEKKQQQKLTVVVKANYKLKKPILGFSIKNASGQIIVGSNSKLQSVEIGDFQKGGNKEISFTIPNIFSDGKYTVDVAILEEDALTVCDWWEDAVSFTSYEDQKSIALASPLININVKDK